MLGSNATGATGGYVAGMPGPRSSSSCDRDALTDTVYCFGGYGFNSTANAIGKLGDFWSYSPLLNNWTFLSGTLLRDDPIVPSNHPRPSRFSYLKVDSQRGIAYVNAELGGGMSQIFCLSAFANVAYCIN